MNWRSENWEGRLVMLASWALGAATALFLGSMVLYALLSGLHALGL